MREVHSDIKDTKELSKSPNFILKIHYWMNKAPKDHSQEYIWLSGMLYSASFTALGIDEIISLKTTGSLFLDKSLSFIILAIFFYWFWNLLKLIFSLFKRREIILPVKYYLVFAFAFLSMTYLFYGSLIKIISIFNKKLCGNK